MDYGLTVKGQTLPDTPRELVQFVFLNEEKLNAAMAAIRAATKSGVIREQLTQMQSEASVLSRDIVIAQIELGRIAKEMQKATNGGANQHGASRQRSAESKEQQLSKLGIPHQRASEYTAMYKATVDEHDNPVKDNVVSRVLAESEANNTIVTKGTVIRAMAEEKAKQHEPPRDFQHEAALARAEHRDFQSRVQDAVIVSVSDIQNDNNNLRTMSEAFARKFSSICSSVVFFTEISREEAAERYKNMTDQEKTSFVKDIDTVLKRVNELKDKVMNT